MRSASTVVIGEEGRNAGEQDAEGDSLVCGAGEAAVATAVEVGGVDGWAG